MTTAAQVIGVNFGIGAVVAADDAFKDANIQSRAYTDKPSIPAGRFGCNIGAGLISAELNELTAAMHVAREANKLDLDTVRDALAWEFAG